MFYHLFLLHYLLFLLPFPVRRRRKGNKVRKKVGERIRKSPQKKASANDNLISQMKKKVEQATKEMGTRPSKSQLAEKQKAFEDLTNIAEKAKKDQLVKTAVALYNIPKVEASRKNVTELQELIKKMEQLGRKQKLSEMQQKLAEKLQSLLKKTNENSKEKQRSDVKEVLDDVLDKIVKKADLAEASQARAVPEKKERDTSS